MRILAFSHALSAFLCCQVVVVRAQRFSLAVFFFLSTARETNAQTLLLGALARILDHSTMSPPVTASRPLTSEIQVINA